MRNRLFIAVLLVKKMRGTTASMHSCPFMLYIPYLLVFTFQASGTIRVTYDTLRSLVRYSTPGSSGCFNSTIEILSRPKSQDILRPVTLQMLHKLSSDFRFLTFKSFDLRRKTHHADLLICWLLQRKCILSRKVLAKSLMIERMLWHQQIYYDVFSVETLFLNLINIGFALEAQNFLGTFTLNIFYPFYLASRCGAPCGFYPAL